MQALVDLGVETIVCNVHTRSKLGALVAEDPCPSPLGDAANAALVAWSTLITAKQKDDRADRKAKSSKKLNIASAKAAPLTIDAQQAAVNELRRRKASEGKGGKRKRAQQDEGEEEDAEDLLAAAREAGCHHLDDDDEDCLVADSEQGPAFVLS